MIRNFKINKGMVFRLFAISVIAQLVVINLQAQSPTKIKEYNQSFTTYPFSDQNPIPSFSKIYPYFRYDGFTD